MSWIQLIDNIGPHTFIYQAHCRFVFFSSFFLKETNTLYLYNLDLDQMINERMKQNVLLFWERKKKKKKRKKESGVPWRPPIIVQTTPDVAWHKWTDTNICFQLAMEAAM